MLAQHLLALILPREDKIPLARLHVLLQLTHLADLPLLREALLMLQLPQELALPCHLEILQIFETAFIESPLKFAGRFVV